MSAYELKECFPVSRISTLIRFRSLRMLALCLVASLALFAPHSTAKRSSIQQANRQLRRDPAQRQQTGQSSTYRNKYSMEFELIPAGRFSMGSTNGDSNEKPVHKVTISQPFYMGRYEVTQGQWQAVMGSNPSKFKDCGANCPVEQVSWSAAQDFITTLNEANDGYKYRLPSEAEWEYACRGGTTGDYYGNVDDIGWYAGNSGRKTHAVGGKQPNAFGLYDMSGNVWEWCVDFYHGNYHGAPTDGSAWVSGGDPIPYRVLRGGSWDDLASSLRSANRIRLTPAYRDYSYGVRVVAVVRTP
jgi:formylglycine-generating enzyme required for sulfatase activity